MTETKKDPTMERLEDQINWYDKKSLTNQRLFKLLKIAIIVSAALIPFLSGLGTPVHISGGLGVLIVILEGLQQLNQYQQNWIIYRSTCEALKHEKYLFLKRAGDYAQTPNPEILLAERIEGLVSTEHAKWVSSREQTSKPKAG